MLQQWFFGPDVRIVADCTMQSPGSKHPCKSPPNLDLLTMSSDSPITARLSLVILVILALAGAALGFSGGQLPRRDSTETNVATAEGLAPDLALYCEVIADVRSGRDYYDSARERIPQYGFPIASPLNWRLPTYAWLLSRLPCNGWIQLALIGLSIAALGLAFVGQCRSHGVGLAAVTTFFLFGVVRWAVDGHAYLAQEPWAATLILLSLGAYSLSSGKSAWRGVAVVSGIAALLFRELVLPYCLVAAALAAWNRRWWETVSWTAGIGLFFGFFAWHMGQVEAQLAGTEVVASTGLLQWLRFGGLDFVLLTTRMNSLLFGAPGWLLWLYLLATLVGLARSREESSQLACLAALLYVAAFAVLGRPENFYWGLMPAPLVAWGAGETGKLALAFFEWKVQMAACPEVASAACEPKRAS